MADIKPEEYLKENGFTISKKKPHLGFKENGENMEYIDLEKMSCYAYSKGTPTEADNKTQVTLRSLKALMDKNQQRLF